jgi:hypothetical protein
VARIYLSLRRERVTTVYLILIEASEEGRGLAYKKVYMIVNATNRDR